MNAKIEKLTASGAMRLLATTQMRSMTSAERYDWAGCESDDPLIGHNDGLTLVLDDVTLGIYGEDVTSGFAQLDIESMQLDRL